MGVGIGGARASGYGSVLLSNIGCIGTAAYLVFVARIKVPGGRMAALNIRAYRVAQASKMAVFTGLLAATISLSVFDIGMLYYLFAAAATVLAMPLAARHVNKSQPHLRHGSCRRDSALDVGVGASVC